MEKINFVNGEIKGVVGRDLVGCKIRITDSILLREIEAECERHCYADIIERMAYSKPETIQEAEDQLNYYWKDIWLTDGLMFKSEYNKIIIGSEAHDNDGKPEGWIYNDLMTIEITE